jgi:uncharacterized protein YcgL (UPF0745 family)
MMCLLYRTLKKKQTELYTMKLVTMLLLYDT